MKPKCKSNFQWLLRHCNFHVAINFCLKIDVPVMFHIFMLYVYFDKLLINSGVASSQLDSHRVAYVLLYIGTWRDLRFTWHTWRYPSWPRKLILKTRLSLSELPTTPLVSTWFISKCRLKQMLAIVKAYIIKHTYINTCTSRLYSEIGLAEHTKIIFFLFKTYVGIGPIIKQ